MNVASGNTSVTFGKYQGLTFEQVKQTDVSYCNWVLKQLETAGKMKEFQEWLKKTSNKATCEMCNGTGKMCVV